MKYDNTHVVWNYNMPLWAFIISFILMVFWFISPFMLGVGIMGHSKLLIWVGSAILIGAPLIYAIGGVLWDGWL